MYRFPNIIILSKGGYYAKRRLHPIGDLAIRENGKRLVEFLQAASHLILALCLLMALKAALEKKGHDDR